MLYHQYLNISNNLSITKTLYFMHTNLCENEIPTTLIKCSLSQAIKLFVMTAY